MLVVYGTNKFNGEGGEERRVKGIKVHPQFTAIIYQQSSFTTYSNDLALLEVDAIKYR